jgi:hypothetical protein
LILSIDIIDYMGTGMTARLLEPILIADEPQYADL